MLIFISSYCRTPISTQVLFYVHCIRLKSDHRSTKSSKIITIHTSFKTQFSCRMMPKQSVCMRKISLKTPAYSSEIAQLTLHSLYIEQEFSIIVYRMNEKQYLREFRLLKINNKILFNVFKTTFLMSTHSLLVFSYSNKYSKLIS